MFFGLEELMRNNDNLEDLPAGTIVRQDRDGWYWVLPDGTARRRSVIVGWDDVTVVQTDMTKAATVRISVRTSQLARSRTASRQ
jgi:hypothetical protein